MLERDRLVDGAALELPDADRAEHEVRAIDRVVEVGGRAERQPVAVLGGLALEHEADPLEPLGIDVVQDDLVESDRGVAVEQRAVDERHTKAAPSDDRKFHAGRIPAMPAPESSAFGTNPQAGAAVSAGP